MKGGKRERRCSEESRLENAVLFKIEPKWRTDTGQQEAPEPDRIYREGERQAKVLKKPIFREMCLAKILKKTRKNSEKKISSYL